MVVFMARLVHRELVAAVLAGEASYDGLDSKDQELVRGEWAARTAEGLANLDLRARFIAEGSTWVELDDDGHVVRRSAANPG